MSVKESAVQILPNAPAIDFADTEGKMAFSAVESTQILFLNQNFRGFVVSGFWFVFFFFLTYA